MSVRSLLELLLTLTVASGYECDSGASFIPLQFYYAAHRHHSLPKAQCLRKKKQKDSAQGAWGVVLVIAKAGTVSPRLGQTHSSTVAPHMFAPLTQAERRALRSAPAADVPQQLAALLARHHTRVIVRVLLS